MAITGPIEGVAADGTITHSVLTCPECGHVEELEMPTNACQFYHECSGCHVLLKPKKGDCCVFCSYGDIPCPPIQISGKSCCSGD